MAILLAILISGVVLDSKDVPLSDHNLVFINAHGKTVKVATDGNGKFQIDLAPGIYRYELGSNDQYCRTGTILIYENMQPLKLKPRVPKPDVLSAIRKPNTC